MIDKKFMIKFADGDFGLDKFVVTAINGDCYFAFYCEDGLLRAKTQKIHITEFAEGEMREGKMYSSLDGWRTKSYIFLGN